MQNIGEVNDDSLGGLVDADTLRNMTITKEELYDKQKDELLQSLMSSMVSLATTNGVQEYSASLNPLFDVALLDDIKNDLDKLGYSVSITNENSPTMGDYIALHVSWKETNVLS